MSSLDQKRERLLAWLSDLSSCAVAFSGGVDSTVLAKAAFLVLGDRAVAVTAVSPSLAEGELEEARQLAALIGIAHRAMDTSELSRPEYTQNAPDRCYHCKTELYEQLGRLNDQLDVQVVVNGANLDDTGDYRPGMRAAREHGVRSPLVECKITKQDVRELARQWELPVWDKPAAPCLSSRVAYGEEVTPERLRMVDRAEQFLRSHGLRHVRVRYHRGDLARLEVPVEDLSAICAAEFRVELVERFRSLGFRFITLDLEGFRSGSLNTLVPLDDLVRFQ